MNDIYNNNNYRDEAGNVIDQRHVIIRKLIQNKIMKRSQGISVIYIVMKIGLRNIS